ncbi:MAG: DUF89 family protein [Candidatus Bathyarchaeota archaeon]|nr:MAG: DUF89 family protein [Candidatus Bathyarchaeota archaeon]
MKVEVKCAACIFHRGCLEIVEATNDLSIQFKTVSALTRLLVDQFNPDTVPAFLGTERDRLIKRLTGNPDPYAKRKQLSNRRALETLSLARKIVSDQSRTESRFRWACLSSIVGNIIEFDIPDHKFGFQDVEDSILRAEEDLVIDEIPKIFDAAKKAKRVLYLTDNAGEIAFDTLLIQEFKKLGGHVTVAVKGKPISNDATLEDAIFVGMREVTDNIITTGTDVVGLIPSECSDEFLASYNVADLVVAKGMGHAETLTELSLTSPHVLLMRTKCTPVANFFNVSRGKNVAKLMS